MSDQPISQPIQLQTGKDRLAGDPKYQLYQKIIIGWLVAYVLIRIIAAILISANATSSASFAFLITFGLLFALPGFIVLFGLIKVKSWAYGLYMFGLLASIFTFTNSTGLAAVIIQSVLSLGSLVVLILTGKLFWGLFPSKKRQITS